MAIMDFILHTMIKRQMQPEDGTKLLKQILQKHVLQRPPYSIFIFTEHECLDLVNSMMRTFFRHYSLYEYSFKPKVELVLNTIPKGGYKQVDISLNKDEMTKSMQGKPSFLDRPVTDTEMEGVLNKNKSIPSIGGVTGDGAAPGSNREVLDASKAGSVEDQEVSQIDWDKVGKIYKPESAIEHIIGKEMGRLQQALDQKIEMQD